MAEKPFNTDTVVKFIDLNAVVRKTRECVEADRIQKYVLDYTWRRSSIHKSLLPLYMIHRYFSNEVDLTSGEVLKVLRLLNVKISAPNVSRGLETGGKYL